MLNIVIPMAGAGSRFENNGYKDPKPLIPIHGIPMIKLVINNLKPISDHRFIFICQNTHIDKYGLIEKFDCWAPGNVVIGIDNVTEGAACSVLTANNYIDNDDALMIANSDQYVDIDINIYLAHLANENLDGMIMTMNADDPKWSFVDLNEAGVVKRVVEKEVISSEATVGIYNFARGRDFVSAAKRMIEANERINGEFYVAPVYNQQIKFGGKIGIYNIGNDGNGMYGLGIPTDLVKFLQSPISIKATKDSG